MKSFVLGVLAVAAAGCNAISHDPAVAARGAVEYGMTAFVAGDADRSYALLSDEIKTTTAPEKYREILTGLHPASRPLSLTATEFEPVPGQELIQIFLHGENGPERFHYRVVMQGTVRAGYRVAGMFRGSGPYPPSALRKHL